VKTRNAGGKLLTGLVFTFLYIPILVLVAFSFNSTKSRSIWSGFTLDWYAELFRDQSIMSSLQVTLLVSLIASVIATIVGTFAAIGFFNMRRRWRNPLLTVNNIPVINADIITGVSLSLLFVSAGALMGFDLGFGTLLIAHISFNIPYVILSVMPKLYQLDRNLFEAAQDLGCTWRQTIFKVIIPEIMPGIVNGMLIAFTMSVDDFVISYFTAGNVLTLSMNIYSMTRRRVSPKINAISTLLFALVLIILVIVNVREQRQARLQERRERALETNPVSVKDF
jgi:spermidine/putrescine transport system permease protein